MTGPKVAGRLSPGMDSPAAESRNGARALAIAEAEAARGEGEGEGERAAESQTLLLTGRRLEGHSATRNGCCFVQGQAQRGKQLGQSRRPGDGGGPSHLKIVEQKIAESRPTTVHPTPPYEATSLPHCTSHCTLRSTSAQVFIYQPIILLTSMYSTSRPNIGPSSMPCARPRMPREAV